MGCTFIYLFICYLHKLMPLVDYDGKEKKVKESQKHALIIFFVFRPILGFTTATRIQGGIRSSHSQQYCARIKTHLLRDILPLKHFYIH
jgi:hypothetical protein